jgi:hypothetical protein
MLKLVAILATLCAHAAVGRCQTSTVVDFGAPLADWQLVDLSGDGRSDVLAFFDGGGGPRSVVVALQQPDGSFAKSAPVALPADVVSLVFGSFARAAGYDVALISTAGVALLTIDAAGAPSIGPVILKVQNLFRAPTAQAPAVWHWPMDIDKDGRHDVFIPGDEGVVVAFGDGKGGFNGKTVLLPIAGQRYVEEASDGAFDFVRSYPRPVFDDVAGDGGLDLVWFDEAGLFFVTQTAPRIFADVPRQFALSWVSGGDAVGLVEQTDVQLADVDRNGKADLVLAKMQARDGQIGDMQTTLVVLVNDGTEAAFKRQPQTALKLKGIVGVGPKVVDVNKDGRVDLVLGTYAGGLSDAVSRVFSRVPVTLYAHYGTGNPKAPFSNAPDFSVKESLSSDDFEAWGARASLGLWSDFDGDDVVDLFTMVRSGQERTAAVRLGTVEGARLVVRGKPAWTKRADDIEGASIRVIRGDDRAALVLERKQSLEFVESKR